MCFSSRLSSSGKHTIILNLVNYDTICIVKIHKTVVLVIYTGIKIHEDVVFMMHNINAILYVS